MTKDEARSIYAARRDALSEEFRRNAGRAVLAHLRGFAAYARARTVFVYNAMRTEMPTAPILEDLWARGAVVALPRVVSGTEMRALEVRRGDALERSRFGVMEPFIGAREVPAQEMDLVLVPGLAFDAEGYRLGYGAGYYDRYLDATRMCRVGLGFEVQRAEAIPHTARDIRMHAIATEDGVRMIWGIKA